MIDGVFEPDQGSNEAVRFREAVLTDADVQWVQARVRQRVLRWFVRQGYLDKDDAKDMARWSNGGGFSVDASVRVGADDRAGLEPVSPVSPTKLPHEYRFRVESHPSPELRQCPLSVFCGRWADPLRMTGPGRFQPVIGGRLTGRKHGRAAGRGPARWDAVA